MNRFIIDLIKFLLVAFLAVCMLCTAFFCMVAPQYSQGYNASIIDKMYRLSDLHDQNISKVILVGDSNLPYGIDSSIIEDELHMPVVNLGIHGGLGNAFQENMIRGFLNQGDIVIVSETSYSGEGRIYDKELGWITIENHFDLWRLIEPEDRIYMLKAFPKYVVKALELWLTHTGNQSAGNSYARDAFNIYGDVIYDRPDGGKEMVGAAHTGLPSVDDDATDRLNQLYLYCQEHGADMVVAAYPIMVDEYTPAREEYRQFQSDLQEKLYARVITDFTDYFFDKDLFYNTAYHMTSHGAELRTRLLARDLKGYLQTK